ncbi:MAG: hypothetical protein AAFR55_06700, partial [Pseudomonadota bacterium]
MTLSPLRATPPDMDAFHHEIDLLREVAEGIRVSLEAHDDWEVFAGTGGATSGLKADDRFVAWQRVLIAIDALESGSGSKTTPVRDGDDERIAYKRAALDGSALLVGRRVTAPHSGDNRDGSETNDLPLIRGVTAADANALRASGVTGFDDIAAWTADDVERNARQLSAAAGPPATVTSVHARITRGVWIEQAAALAMRIAGPAAKLAPAPVAETIAAPPPEPQSRTEPNRDPQPTVVEIVAAPVPDVPPPIDDLAAIAGLTDEHRAALNGAGITTTSGLAALTHDSWQSLKSTLPQLDMFLRASALEQAAMLATGRPTAAMTNARVIDVPLATGPDNDIWTPRLASAIRPVKPLAERVREITQGAGLALAGPAELSGTVAMPVGTVVLPPPLPVEEPVSEPADDVPIAAAVTALALSADDAAAPDAASGPPPLPEIAATDGAART